MCLFAKEGRVVFIVVWAKGHEREGWADLHRRKGGREGGRGVVVMLSIAREKLLHLLVSADF